MKKTAFTVVEVLVCIVIIGVLTVISLNVMTNQSHNQYSKLYNTAYDSLVQAVGNAYLDWTPGQDQGWEEAYLTDGNYYCWSKKCWEVYTGNHPQMQLDQETGNWYVQYNGKNIIVKYKDGNTDETLFYGGDINFPRRYPGFLMGKHHKDGDYLGGRYDGWGTDEAFCKDIVQYFNTIATDNECTSFLTGVERDGNNPTNPMKGGSFHDVFCALDPPELGLEPSGNCQETHDNQLYPSFITSNGQKYYISAITTANLPILSAETGENKRLRRYFRFIAVDLNGDSKPNRQYAKGAKFPWLSTIGGVTETDTGSYPDIVLFAITDNGVVVPLGLPEFSTVYATAKVYFPEYLNEIVNIDGIDQFKRNTQDTSTTMNLFDAKLTAWGSNTANTSNLVCGQPVSDSNPLTYAEVFYWIALNCGADGCDGKTSYPICLDQSSENTPIKVDPLMANLVRQFIFIEPGKDINEVGPKGNTFIPEIINNSLLDTEHGCTSTISKCKVQIEQEK